ncbi:monovalent cation/H(+) antiporter subunit G [Vibrio genomosp. F10]|uniref:Na+/H+ antiporter subunit G n=2 Tax=Vibrio genomosp. F10 TaxID=723171 RepID=A0A1B9QWJ1_9VIBR|nr:monovalent cation/H(+) antiporter subunit G [Vibrio genomosp. F10]OCH73975.1 Na+/H+ antiporter subunit G [Vibrio genomosp. F10]OEE32640.1 Na+/H+ antiporter subunit G [Vibrio genomosp. F10 str. ZF-129]OEE91899.1 Na+/H+ antiporter subunit G [Vibrio genomosp. F10 str. 9ZD137]OEE98394.1 Na+/H+ antiporter subunit G [Vibrio genomosp. F10 str. 9ZC157]OEF07636.1 Na+/H+ antiporter subunit G [Vibrio genomosp. F10 str. 9ZB36]
MIDMIVAFFVLTGACLMLLASIGINRMPDLLTRMHATTKAGALGIGLIVVAFSIIFWSDTAVVVRAMAVVLFVILTAPIAAHVLARTSYFVGVPVWEGTVKDAIKEQYDMDTHQLSSRCAEKKKASE